ncbi:MAG: DHH family phosphoesterase [Phycisphaerae bacterium]|nr:DHH family phosphoesterase [Phycisphaerae bacterium]
MSEKSSGNHEVVGSLDAVAGRLAEAGNILLVTHGRPDGDGLGSMLALATAARGAGKDVHMLVPGEIPARLGFMFDRQHPGGTDEFGALSEASDLIVILDTHALAQLDGLADALGRLSDRIVVIDHHSTGDALSEVVWIDPSAAATGVMAGEVIDALKWPMDATIAEALLAAVLTDTGWLRFANTDGRCLRAVAHWTDLGVRPDILYRKIYQSDRPQRLALMIRLLQSMEFRFDSQLAVMTLRSGDFDETGALRSETENMVNEALRIGTVESAILLVEDHDQVRVSLRSRDHVDVAKLAGQFGGGGHRRAAGLRSSMQIDDLKAQLITAWGKEFSAGD